jgi:predicted TPR repeat methyltransferase
MYLESNSEYLKKNPTWHVEDSPWKAKQILKIINNNKLTPKNIVEVGCGAGEILNQLYHSMPDDVIFTGYDISTDAITLAKKSEKDRLTFSLENILQSKKVFDLLLLIDVVEHIDDYLGFLESIKTKAKYTIFHFPLDISVQGILRNKLISHRQSAGHLHYFTKDTVLATLIETGYNIVDYFYTLSSTEIPRKTLKSKFAVLPRRILFKINKDFAANFMGGFSLLVLTK